MSKFTYDIDELEKRWMKLYLNLSLLRSHNPKASKLLEDFKMKLVEFNEHTSKFFDDMRQPA